MKQNKEENPMFTKKGALMWLLCAPVAIALTAHYETKIANEKRRAKKAKKDAEFRRKYPEFWFFSD